MVADSTPNSRSHGRRIGGDTPHADSRSAAVKGTHRDVPDHCRVVPDFALKRNRIAWQNMAVCMQLKSKSLF